jgi:hypothetical protein
MNSSWFDDTESEREWEEDLDADDVESEREREEDSDDQVYFICPEHAAGAKPPSTEQETSSLPGQKI